MRLRRRREGQVSERLCRDACVSGGVARKGILGIPWIIVQLPLHHGLLGRLRTERTGRDGRNDDDHPQLSQGYSAAA
jgi:hypothetical protein